MSRLIPIIFALSAIVIPNTIAAHESTAPKKPNILLILADDMGYSDLGCFGGEFHTPNLDRLAKNGLRYTQFYNTARCWPSRAAILTGYYAQQVRRDTIPGVLQNGMAGIRPTWAKLLPERLKPLGYRTYHSGKWHVDGTPLKNGFDRSYWVEDQDRHFNPKDLYRDDVKLPPVPRGTTYYDATAIADSAVEFLSDHASQHADQPFFEYLAFTTPHFPLMAPAEDIAKYSGRFHAGWDQLRKERLARMKKIGILNCDLSDRTPGVPAWDTLSTAEQDAWERRIEVHAAMVDRIDQEVGRVLDQLKKTRDLDNTLIFFLSDNGASAEKLVRGDGNDPNAAPGSAGSFLCLEPAGANLCNAPLKRSKIFTHEGGISTSLIVHWPARIKSKGQFRRTPSHLIDLAPTILEIAGAAPGAGQSLGGPVPPGSSLVPTFTVDGTPHDHLWWFHQGNKALRMGDWKIVTLGANSPWELYNLAKDRSETKDLASQFPEKVNEMAALWRKRMDEFKTDATVSKL